MIDPKLTMHSEMFALKAPLHSNLLLYPVSSLLLPFHQTLDLLNLA